MSLHTPARPCPPSFRTAWNSRVCWTNLHWYLAAALGLLSVVGQIAHADEPPPTRPSLPRIQMGDTVYDFGRIVFGETVRHEFVFTNTGSGPLEVLNVKTSCGCTTAGAWSKHVEAGGRGVIPIEFHSANFDGPVSKSILVTHNDSNTPPVTLQLKGMVWVPIDVFPKGLRMDPSQGGESNRVRVIRISSRVPEPVILATPVSDNPVFVPEVISVKPGKEYQLLVKLMPWSSSGNQIGEIKIKTSLSVLPQLTIPVFATAWPKNTPLGLQTGSSSQRVANPTRTMTASGLQLVDAVQVDQLIRDPAYAAGKIVLIDARGDASFREGHIRGAHQLDRYHVEQFLPLVLPSCRAANEIVVYCQGGECEDSEWTALRLSEEGIPKERLRLYSGGIEDWTGKSFPLEIGARTEADKPLSPR